MTDPTDHPASEDSPPGMPRWVKVSAIIVGILVLVFLILQLTGIGGEHGPGRHMPGVQVPAQVTAAWIR